ncbi:DUF2147 domain-containing protein [Chryseobacterium sp. WLY505]|uniref:DUF2147 domain-containing protein n=1 Tax=Chryseobacterium sp. WLY505 TaxID=3068892 RepID=UPI002796448B|nr:DUF2147 domain-containing protein [Chryseobacterium sp. WLY505]MDQ1856986.1 DUF2147 domain-containing protein [Chryseobacterium sp. WLY505]
MKTTKTLIIVMLAMFVSTYAQSEKAIVGNWESDKKDVRIEILKEGDTYSGNYLWGKDIVEKDGITSKKDIKNPDVKLRSRNVVGIKSLTGLVWNGKEYVNGKIYNAPSGDTYSCKIWIKNDKLYLRGYLGLSLLGQTATFHKYK